MSQYRVTLRTHLEVVVLVEADDEDQAAITGWDVAEEYARTLGTQTGDSRIVGVEASFDGIGADEVVEQ